MKTEAFSPGPLDEAGVKRPGREGADRFDRACG